MKSFKLFLSEENLLQQNQNDDPFENNPQIKSLYGAIVSAEHTGAKIDDPYAFNKDLYIRTKAGGGKSSAYGPVQITGSTAKGFKKTQPELFKNIDDYSNKFITQGSQMLKSNIKDPKYGLGCVGDLCSENEHTNYQKLAAAVIKGKAKEKKIDLSKPLSDQDINTFVTSWRGVDEKADSRYFNEFRKGYAKHSAVKKEEVPQPPQQPSS
jgi:hypothetical protein